MTIAEVVSKARGCTVRIQVIRDGYTEFIANEEMLNFLLTRTTKNTPVDHIKVEYENETPILHIYGINYLDYHN